ncbi:MAG: hypothetical protein ILA34_03070 [Bacteroidaceae bacterium]|nr:hypothetical protein [Bacteroidaceae bacterium]
MTCKTRKWAACLPLLCLFVHLPVAHGAMRDGQPRLTNSEVQLAADGDEEYNPHVLIVCYDSAVGPRPLLRAARRWHAKVIYQYRIIPGMALSMPKDRGMEKSIRYFKKVKGVVQVSRDRVYHLH